MQPTLPTLSMLALVGVLTGCPRSPETPSTTPDDTAAIETLEGTEAPATGETSVTAILESGDHVAITVANGSEAPVELRRELIVEQETDEGWEPLEAVGALLLRTSCDEAAAAPADTPEGRCRRLEARRQVEVPAWLGTFGDAQCVCERCASVPAARYRIVAETCTGDRIVSEPVAIRLDEDHPD